ncbi:DinB/UmuC family translesion DNA polymerase [Streptomyces hydrogenans]|uniref:DinB/UmuC family translesion DNA polymerase n=1 Tax=Streptomyces hydrogenans TaxID=1873719 RepID=UPI0033A7576E
MPESTSAHTAFRRDETDATSVCAAVLDLVVTVGERIRRHDQVARKVTLAVGLAGGASVSRTWTLPAASGTPRTWAVRRTGSSTDWRSSVPGSGGSS